MKTISEETARILETAFHGAAADVVVQGNPVKGGEIRSHGWVTHMGRQFYVTLREVQEREAVYNRFYRTVSRDYTIRPVDEEWRLSRHVSGNPCGEIPIHVRFVGDRAAFERDIIMLKMLVHKPVSDVRMAV